MSDLGEAAAGAMALIVGGLLFISIASDLKSTPSVDFTLWGVLFIVIGFLLLVTLLAIAIGEIYARLT